MKDKPQTLKNLLIEELPPDFVRDLISGMDSIYADSFSHIMNDPDLGEVQAKGALGHYRRAKAETHLQRMAVKHGLRQKDTQPEGGGCTHVSVYTEKFELVMCHVHSANAFPNPSDDRKQASSVNEYLPQQFNLAFPEEARELKVNEPELFYGIIVHSEVAAGKKKEFGSIKIGFPNHSFDGWLDKPICLKEIAQLQTDKEQETPDLQAAIQDVGPKLKTNIKKTKAANEE